MNFMPSRSLVGSCPPKLVIFDFDGTLAETEILVAEIISAKLTLLGFDVAAHAVSSALSGAAKEQDQPLLEALIRSRLPEGFIEDVRIDWRAAISSGVVPTRGAVDALEGLPIPYCIASNASRPDLIHRMRSAGLLRLVGPRFFSSDDVGLRKPDPSVFLLAAEVMGVEPDECLVIEDSSVGLEAARRAHMRSCAFVGGKHHSPQMQGELRMFGPDLVISDLSELKLLLTEICGSSALAHPASL
ncbi:HAD family hydrolase [Neorhizobium lilium]|nr:HAD-IA family hydrolase [Neorhizobium lilium]